MSPVLISTVSRAVVSLIESYYVGDWIAISGVAEPFGIFAMLMGIFGLTAVPVFIWGKRMRIATATWVLTSPEGHRR